MRFLIDENLPVDLAAMLDALGHDALAVIDSPLRGQSDELIWASAVSDQRILITQDLDFPLNATQKPPGLVLIRLPSAFDIDTLIDRLQGFFATQNDESLLGKITVVEPARTRSRDF